MRSAWVTGAGGFVGGHLARHLAGAGWRVSHVRARPGEALENTPKPADVVFHVGGLAGGRRSRADFLAANCALAVALYEAAVAADCRGFVFVSSAKVLGEVCVHPAAEDAPRAPVGAYAESKALAEERLLAARRRHGLPLAIVRPPLVYGEGVRGGFRLLLRGLARGAPLPLADATGLRSMVSVTNLTHALALLGVHMADAAKTPSASAAIWHVHDGEDISTAALCQTLAERLRRPARLWRLPSPIRAAAARLGGDAALASAFAPLRLDDGALRRQHGWVPPQSRPEAICATVRWFTEAFGGAND